MVSIHVLDHTETSNCVLQFLSRPGDQYDLRWEGLCGAHWDRRWSFRRGIPLLVEAEVGLSRIRISAKSRSRADRLLGEHAGDTGWHLEREEHGWYFYKRSTP
jgi:hypothetical protein